MAVVLAVLAALYLVMPSTLFGATGADHRLPLVLALVLIGGSAWRAPALNLRYAFFGAATALLALRLGMVAVSWQASGQAYAQILPALDNLPEGGCLAVAFPDGETGVEATPLLHLPVLAIARRDEFVPSLFTFASQQPVNFTPDYRAMADALQPGALWAHFALGGTPLDDATSRALARCDDVAFYSRKAFTLADGAGLEPVFQSPRFQIYRLTHDNVKP